MTTNRTKKFLVQDTNKDYIRYTNLDNRTNHDYKRRNKNLVRITNHDYKKDDATK
jgi:hypothetical protein